MTKSQVVLNTGAAQAPLDRLTSLLAKPRPLFKAIAGLLESETELNFAAQGRPNWVPLAKATVKARQKRNGGGSVLMMLQDRGILAASVTSGHGDDYATIGANTPYAAAQQLGATIQKPERETKVRLREDAKGNLVRQAADERLAVFAKKTHKRARETTATIGAHTIKIPARPYLPFKGTVESGTLQPETEVKLLELVTGMLNQSLG